MKRVALHNLGCKVNYYETEVMRQSLRERGFQMVPFDREADIYIVNTCTVTNIADRKSRQILHRAKQCNPDAVVVAVGCYVQTGREAVERDDCIDLAIGNEHKKDIADILEAYLEGRQSVTIQENAGKICEYEEMQLRHTGEHTRAYVKIQDGCNQFCTYWAIPYARGRARSRRAEDVIAEVSGLAREGCREIVLTGIHISSYGIDFDEEAWQGGRSERLLRGMRPEYTGGSKLIDLAEMLHEIPGVERIRLGSLEPRVITEETAGRLAAMSKICPHFHLSLQSGCDATLKRMNRHYTTGEYYQSVEILRKFFDHPAITTDVIVGFPGETEEEFGRTRAFLEKIRFYEMHVFKYSRREGTVAASMPGQLSEQVKTARSSELLELEGRQSVEFRRHYIGREAEVLLEETRELDGKRYLIGHTKDYVKVAVEADCTLPRGEMPKINSLVKVPVRKFMTDEILA